MSEQPNPNCNCIHEGGQPHLAERVGPHHWYGCPLRQEPLSPSAVLVSEKSVGELAEVAASIIKVVRDVGNTAGRQERKVIECSDVALLSWADALEAALTDLRARAERGERIEAAARQHVESAHGLTFNRKHEALVAALAPNPARGRARTHLTRRAA